MAELEASRRNVIAGLAAAGVAGPLLAGCGGDGGGGGGGEPAGGTATTGDVPVGGGRIYGDEKFVITQPTEGQFKAFSAVCTHQSCLVSSVEDSRIKCSCHGSQFSIADGSVQEGPAGKPLPELTVTVNGDELTVDS